MKLYHLSFFILSILISSCGRNQDEDAELDLDTEVAVSEVEVEKTFSTIDNIVNQAEVGNTVTKKTTEQNDILSGCATITKDTLPGAVIDTIQISVDFGSTPCEGDDGIERQGKITIINFVDNSSYIRKERKVETNNFYSNGHQIQITDKQIYDGLDPQNNHKWIQTIDASILYSNGSSVERSSSRIKVWVEGATTTLDWTDDVFTFEGQSTGKRIDGKTISTETIKTLMVRSDCSNIVSGEVKIVTDGRPDLSINYGDGTCDDKATATSQGETWTVNL